MSNRPGEEAGGNLRDALADYLQAQDALDNREYMGINGEDYGVLMRRRNAARRDLEEVLATPESTAAKDKLQAVHKAWAALDTWWSKWLDTQRYTREVERAEWTEWQDMRKAMQAATRADNSDLRALLSVASAHLSICSSTDDTMPGHPACDCGAPGAAAAAPSQDAERLDFIEDRLRAGLRVSFSGRRPIREVIDEARAAQAQGGNHG